MTRLDPRAAGRGWQTRRRWIREAGALIALGALSPNTPRKAQLFYRTFGTQNFFTESSMYINLGYWRARPSTFDAASEALVDLVGGAAELGPTDVVLDVGFGFGDQDLRWVQTVAPRQIIGVTVSREQAAVAQRRFADAGHNTAVVIATASRLPFRADAFTRVVALESAFHFPSRRMFFDESYRILARSGRLTTADVIAGRDARQPDRRVARRVVDAAKAVLHARMYMPLPRDNWYGLSEYRSALGRAGFNGVDVTSIRADVFRPLLEFMRSRLRDAEVRSRVNPMIRFGWRVATARPSIQSWIDMRMDYVIATATKPRVTMTDPSTEGDGYL